jgi:hypothetical protein
MAHPPASRFSSDNPRLSRKRGQAHAAILSDDHIVFNAHAASTGKIDTGFNREGHPGFKQGFFSLSDEGRLMSLKSKTMTRSMMKVLGITGLCNSVPSYLVDAPTGHTRSNRFTAGSVCSSDDLMNLNELIRRIANEE